MLLKGLMAFSLEPATLTYEGGRGKGRASKHELAVLSEAFVRPFAAVATRPLERCYREEYT